MDSSFLSEDGNDPFFPQPLITSTQKKKTLQCPHCSKTYLTQHYFVKHVESHSSQGQDTHDVSSALHLDASDLSFSALKDKDDMQVFKKPAPPKKKAPNAKAQKKKSFVCTYCLKAYVSEKTMHKHMRVHTMQVAAARFPDREEIIRNADDIGERALTKVANCPSFGVSGQLFREFVGHVVGLNNFSNFSTKILKKLVSAIDSKKCMLPSGLMKALFDEMENISCCDEFCDECLSLLEVSDHASDIHSQFLMEFLLHVTTEVLQFISATFRKHFLRPLKPMPELDLEDRQVIYYIGGSIMRGYFRIAHRHKSNVKWQNVSSVLRNQVLSSEPVGDIAAEWTREVDRGGLLYINIPCQKFFISATKVVKRRMGPLIMTKSLA